MESNNDDQAISSLCDAIFALGHNFMRQGQVEKALIIFDGLNALEPNDQRAAIAYGETLLSANLAEKALNHFFTLSKQFELDSRTLLLTAKACILLDRPDEAKKLLSMITSPDITASDEDARSASAMLSML